MPRPQEETATKLRKAIFRNGDRFIKQKGDEIFCILCEKNVRYTDHHMGARIKEHVETIKHTNLVQSVGFESVSDDHVIPFRKAFHPDGVAEEEYQKSTYQAFHPDGVAEEEFHKSTYQAKTTQEITSALASIKPTNGTGDGNPSNFDGDANNQDGDASSSNGAKMSRFNTSDETCRYFKYTGMNESGNDLYNCIFCSYIGIRNIHSFNCHLVSRCPGILPTVREQIKVSGLARVERTKSKKRKTVCTSDNGITSSHVNFHPVLTDEYEEDSGKAVQYEEDSGRAVQYEDDTGRAVQILTELLSEVSAGRKTEEGRNRRRSKKAPKEKAPKRKATEELTEEEIDQEIKVLKLKKMQAEIRVLEERIQNEVLIRRDLEERIKERGEKIKLLKSLNQQFPSLLRVVNSLITPGKAGNELPENEAEEDEENELLASSADSEGDGSVMNSGSNSLLEDAFAETISGSN